MSYILNAIRKAETQRQSETVPSLEAIIGERRSMGRRRPWGRWLVIALIVLTGSAAYFYRSEAVYWGNRAVASAKFRSAHLYRKWFGEGKNVNSVATPKVVEPAEVSANQEAAPASVKLSENQRQALDSIEVSVISYSKDSNKRFVMIGSDVLREGDQLLGFPIQKIQVDGFVIGVNGDSLLIRP